MDESTRQLAETLKNNPAALQALFSSGDGQELLLRLTQQDGGAALQRAAQKASAGNTEDMIRMVSQVMRSPEGAELVARIKKTIQR
jgi:hypothetical protein